MSDECPGGGHYRDRAGDAAGVAKILAPPGAQATLSGRSRPGGATITQEPAQGGGTGAGSLQG